MRARLFLKVLSTESRKLMGYRTDFWITALGGFAVQMAVTVCVWRSIFDAGGGRVAGYTMESVTLYTLLAILLGKFVRGQEYGSNLSREIYEGEYTRYLVYPAGYLPQKYAQHLGNLAPAFVQLALFGALAPLFLPLPAETGITPATVAMCLLSVAAANLLLFLISVPVEAVAFWADNVWSLNVMLRFLTQLLGGLLLPLDVFPPAARHLLSWTPFPYLCYVPVKVLLGEVPPGAWLLGLATTCAWAGAFALLARAVWRRGDRIYTGVGI